MGKKFSNAKTWDFLDKFRGTEFNGEWPTLAQLFEITAQRYPKRNAFTVFEPERITLTYEQALETIRSLATWLREQGVKKGDRVVVSGKNSPEWAVVFFAVAFADGVAVPIDYALHDKEIETLCNTAKPVFSFFDDERFAYFENLSKTNSNIGRVFSLNKNQAEKYVYNLKPQNRSFEKPTNTDEALAALLFTSGTTGNPKGVMLSHRNLVSDAYIAQTHMNLFHTDVFYALLPLHHSYTLLAVLIETVSVGAEVVFGKSLAVTKMLSELKEGKITMLLGVPLLFNKLIAGIMKGIRQKGAVVYGLISALMGLSYGVKKLTGVNIGKKLFGSVLRQVGLDNIRVAICGGGPLAPSVFKKYNEFGVDFVQGYGLTETSPIVALNPIEHFKIESVGRYFHPYAEAKVINPDENGVGELCFKGPMVMQGYYNMPEETRAMFTEDGFLKSGDLGRIDDEYYVYLMGRAKNMIVTSGGKNVYPEEIENAFQLFYNDIEQITVKGWKTGHENSEEEVEAQIYISDNLYSTLALTRGETESDKKAQEKVSEIVNDVNKNLQPYQRITKITFLDKPLEMTTTQKVKRH
ncbi:MAG: AMP-binding protein [Spirochaetaceae bacterium]|nr:AMP-binding protein [Spirochaetaceae bacterium]